MKKSNFVAMILSIFGVLCLGIGMCMSMLPNWGMFQEGIVVGCFGIVILLIMVFVYRKMEHKPRIKISFKTCVVSFFILIGIFALGTGMCLTMVYDNFLLGIVIGIIGIFVLVCPIPIYKGLK